MPVVEVRSWPARAVPVIAGSAVAEGAAALAGMASRASQHMAASRGSADRRRIGPVIGRSAQIPRNYRRFSPKNVATGLALKFSIST